MWVVKSWRCWLALVMLLVPAALLTLSLRDPGRLLYARHDIIAALNPRGKLWVFWGTLRTSATEMIIYDTGGMTYIVTHQPDGTATVQTFTQMTREVPAVLTVRRSQAGRTHGLSCLLSLWWTTLFAGLISTWVWWRAWVRRPRSGCTACGYSREGLAADLACPECGVVVARAR